MPYIQRGGPGKRWLIDLRAASAWRNRQDAISAQQWRGKQTSTEVDGLLERPDHKNGLRLFSEEAIKCFLHDWLYSDMPRAIAGHLHDENGLSKLDVAEVLQLLTFTLFSGLSDWIIADQFNETLKANHDIDLDEMYKRISGRTVSTRPPVDPDLVKFQIPEWLTDGKEQIVKDLWGEKPGF